MAQSDVVTSFGWREVRDQIKTELETLSVVKLVHPFVRFDGRLNNSEERFRKKHIPTGESRINSWALRRIEEQREFLTNREYQVHIIVGLDHWFEVDDDEETQDTFDDTLDAVLTHFQAPIRLTGTVELLNPMQLVTEDWREFAGRLVHHAEFQFDAQHLVHQNTFR